ncbi:Arginine/serine-rich-splicing factor RSP40 [Zostera marina]|uniref:Arginine/serine-rich-splicing factor RSP40 n=1 Tax=Zostera marina TaxID=29655 RepID=A0A0K9PNG6_ZOSMR|nr:Arginine/serine-rich-splicing factor RSP40 [Zostera marina]
MGLMLFSTRTVGGFAFVYMDDERDAEDSIRGLDRYEFGRQGRRLRVEWTKQERSSGRRTGSSRRSSADQRPTKTLFVINFDPINTRSRDLEKHFDPYGKISNIRIRRNFAFIQFELQEDATKALNATNSSTLMDRVISVEYAIRDDDERRNGHSPDRRGHDRSLDRGRDRGRSMSPYGRGAERASPDYGRGSSPYGKKDQRGSPNQERRHSPNQERRHSPNQERRHSPNQERRHSPNLERRHSPNQERRHSPNQERRHSPNQERRDSPNQERRDSPNQERRDSPNQERRGSPNQERRDSPNHERRVSPNHERRVSPNHEGSMSPGNERHRSRSPRKEQSRT